MTMLTPPDEPHDYLCRRPLLTYASMTGRATLCQGKMRLHPAAVVDELPGLTLTMRLLVCETCGRTALPEDHASS